MSVASCPDSALPSGKPVLANPDFVERVKQDLPLNEPDPARFFGGYKRGYTGYSKIALSANVNDANE